MGERMDRIKERRRMRRESALRMRADGYTLTEIADALGCSTATVAELLAEPAPHKGEGTET